LGLAAVRQPFGGAPGDAPHEALNFGGVPPYLVGAVASRRAQSLAFTKTERLPIAQVQLDPHAVELVAHAARDELQRFICTRLLISFLTNHGSRMTIGHGSQRVTRCLTWLFSLLNASTMFLPRHFGHGKYVTPPSVLAVHARSM